MSWIDYRWAVGQLGTRLDPDDDLDYAVIGSSKGDPPFYGVIMLAMHRADTPNMAKLIAAFPFVYAELQARYNAPFRGCLNSDPEGLRKQLMGDHYKPVDQAADVDG